MNQRPSNESSVAERAGCDAVLVVGHGTRNRAGLAEMRETTRLLGRRLKMAAKPCFLEFAEPSIAAAIGDLYEQGTRRLMVLPMLLFSAGHANDDIPAALDVARSTYPDLETRLSGTLDCHNAIVELSTLRHRQAVADVERVSHEETLLLMVGRGSRCEAANAEMARFARLRGQEEPVGKVEVCFAALAPPSLESVLVELKSSPFRRIVVQPHLLFEGQLLNGVQKSFARAQIDCPQKSWVLTEHLGPHALLATALEQSLAVAKPF